MLRLRAYGRQEGYAAYSEDGRVKREATTFCCQHCNKLVFVPLKADPANMGGLCKLCMGLICPACVERNYCDPIEAKIERMEREGEMLRRLIA